MRGVVVGAPASGSGKTVVTLGLLAALRAAGTVVAGAKAGPDYIDGGFLAAAAGAPAPNLDVWAMRPVTLAAALAATAADLCVLEGVMGLFDGIGPAGAGSTADLAARLGWPVVLVVDGRGAATSVAATLLGFRSFRADVEIAGVIVNRVGGAGHAAVIRSACAERCPEVAFLGWLPRRPDLDLPSRHLGLVQAVETADLAALVARATALVAQQIDLAALVALARPPAAGPVAVPMAPPGQRIALAHDPAFAFVYPHLLAAWRAAGAEILPFSPLADEPPPAADVLYLPGGYPELQAGRLAASRRTLSGIAGFPGPVIGECGGYMLLGQALIDGDGQAHAMAGCLPLVASFAERRRHLGYRSMTLCADGPFGPCGTVLRGHEFHFASVVDEGEGPPLYQVADGAGRPLGTAGRRRGRFAGSFLHMIDRVDP